MDEQTSNTNVSKHSRTKLLLLLAVVILIIVAGSGTYYWQHSKLTSSQQKNTSLSAQNVKLNAQIKQLQLAVQTKSTDPLQIAAAVKLVNTFYTQYTAQLGKSATNATSLISQYGTPNLVFYSDYYLHGFNNIVCAQDNPESIEVTGNSVSDNVATTMVKETFGSDVQNITVKVVNQGGLKIDSVECSGAEGNLAPPPEYN